MTTTEILTISDAVQVATIADFAHKNSLITWVNDSGALCHGVARRIGGESGETLRNVDVRDQFLWITTQMGTELFMPMRTAMQHVADGTMGNYGKFL